MSKAMIITVGGTPTPIIKTINEQKPVFICFLASQKTNDKVVEIKKGLTCNVKSEVVLLDNVNDLLHCYNKSVEAAERMLEKGFTPNDVIIDYTGGTKNMSAAVVLATVSYGFVFSYVGGIERDKEGVGIVINGKEKIYHGINPWDFLAVEEKKKIAILFNSCQYQGAKNLIEELMNKVSPSEKPVFEVLRFLVEGFYKWDMFQHKGAKNCFKRANVDSFIGIAKAKEDARLLKFAQSVKQAYGNLIRIVDCLENSKNICLRLMEDLFENAERRYKEGKVDDAILRLYRIVEMAAQERLLTKHKIDTSDVNRSKVPSDFLHELKKTGKDKKNKKIKIGLYDSYNLLDRLGDNLGKSYFNNKEKFLGIQSARNDSYLAHGIASSKSETYTSLKEFVLTINKEIKNVTTFPHMRI
ncbi:MAG: TIGR02710 family CRISPR-associated protein [Gammaproteobacteria bacterium]|nr:TIGR02710 family CRISPR-associated protein [Gammaproteobacteria bacterium]